jgi:hypothetical protein
MKRISLWIVALAFLNPQFAISQERRLEPFIVAYSSITANRAPLWIAKDTGLFEKYGLDVKFVTIAAGNVIMSALLTGGVHLITGAGPQVVAAVAQGVPITIVSTNGGSLFQLVARPSIKILPPNSRRTMPKSHRLVNGVRASLGKPLFVASYLCKPLALAPVAYCPTQAAWLSTKTVDNPGDGPRLLVRRILPNFTGNLIAKGTGKSNHEFGLCPIAENYCSSNGVVVFAVWSDESVSEDRIYPVCRRAIGNQ